MKTENQFAEEIDWLVKWTAVGTFSELGRWQPCFITAVLSLFI